MTWVVDQQYVKQGLTNIDMLSNVQLSSTGFHVQTPLSVSGHFEFNVPNNVDWANLTITLGCDASTFQVPTDGSLVLLGVQWKIVQVYSCSSSDGAITHFTIDANNQAAGFDECFTGGIRSITTLGPGGGSCTMFLSTPLGICNGSQASAGSFSNAPLHPRISISDGTCLCTIGGTPPYTYSIVAGSLPSGVTMDSASGCFHGRPDGITLGSNEFIIQVNDSSSPSQSAQVICDIIFNPCSAGTGAVVNYMY